MNEFWNCLSHSQRDHQTILQGIFIVLLAVVEGKFLLVYIELSFVMYL